jgi:GntR family transcriptional regulator, transcriptional repressor for pyruvate dehydrogenase complex
MDPTKAVEDLLRPVGKSRLHDTISQQLRRLIEEGKLVPGDRLPPERELAERFKVSRNSVRDALRTLEARGLVEIRQGDGTYVRDMQPASLFSGLLDVLVAQKERITLMLQARYALEPGIAAAAALNAQPADIAELEAILARQEEQAGRGDPGVSEDALFHATIARMTGNMILVGIMDLLNQQSVTTRDIVLKYDNSAVRQGHRAVLEALRAGDAEGARQAMASHIAEVMAAYELLA